MSVEITNFFTAENAVLALRVLSIVLAFAACILAIRTFRLAREVRSLLRKLGENK